MPRTARKPAPRADRHSLSNQLRDIIESRGLSAYAVARDAGIDPGVVSRFVSGERDVRLATADKIAAALGLRLVEVGKPRRTSKENRRPIDGSQFATNDPAD